MSLKYHIFSTKNIRVSSKLNEVEIISFPIELAELFIAYLIIHAEIL